MSKDADNLSLKATFPESNAIKISASDRLKFAKQILSWLGCICVGVFIAYPIYPDNKALSAIFELIKIGALPLITLVISFYFSKSNYQETSG